MYFGDLLGWLNRKDSNRRKYPRKSKPYWASVSSDGGTTRKPAIGIDISGGGVCLLTQEPVTMDEFEVYATLDTYSVRARTKSVWQDMGTLGGKTVWRYGAAFTGIAADHWDAIIRYAMDQEVIEGNKAQRDLEAVRMSPDDANRLFPTELQDRLLNMLVDRRRLAPLQENITPLVQYFYYGLVLKKNGPRHALTIQSRIVGPEENETYETSFLFDESGTQVDIVDGPGETETPSFLS
jgi:hypothetical protein